MQSKIIQKHIISKFDSTIYIFFYSENTKILFLTTELRGKGTPIREAINGAISAYKQKRFNSKKSTDINKNIK